MNAVIKRILCIILICFLAFLSSGCGGHFGKPDADKVNAFLSDNYDDIKTVTDYLLQTEYEDAFITSREGQMFADLSYVTIESPTVIDSINALWDSGCVQIILIRVYNTVYFKLWRTFLVGDAECGLAYRIDESKAIDINYLTELQPLDVDDWYYYVADYNEWRAGKNE